MRETFYFILLFFSSTVFAQDLRLEYDANPSGSSMFHSIQEFVEHNGNLYFKAFTNAGSFSDSTNLYRLDSAGAATKIYDYNEGITASHNLISAFNMLFDFDQINGGGQMARINLNGTAAAIGSFDYAIWTEVLGNKVFISGETTSEGFELYYINNAGTNLTVTGNYVAGSSGSDPRQLIKYKSKLYYIVDSKLYSIDENLNVVAISQINDSLTVEDTKPLLIANDKLFIRGTKPGESAISLYSFDGSSSAYFGPFNDYGYFQFEKYFTYNNECYFEYESDGKGLELHKFDGINPPELIVDFSAGSKDSKVYAICEHNGDVYFNIQHDDSSRYEIVRYNGVTANKVDVGLINPKGLFTFDGRIYTTGFSNLASGRDLYSFNYITSNVPDIETQKAIVYPNPSTGFFNISNAHPNSTLEVTDSHGENHFER